MHVEEVFASIQTSCFRDVGEYTGDIRGGQQCEEWRRGQEMTLRK